MSDESTDKPVILGTGEEIPEKFRGKDVQEVLKSYSEAEKAMREKMEETGGVKKELQ